jgi:hypothetical protein
MGYNGKELGKFEQRSLEPIQWEIILKYMVFDTMFLMIRLKII